MTQAIEQRIQDYRAQKQRDISVRARYHETLRDVVRSLEQVIDAALKWYEEVAGISAAAVQMPEPQREQFASRVVAHLRDLYEGSKDDLRELVLLERRGYRVARADEFKWAMHEAEMLATQSQRLMAGVAQVEQGRVTPLAEAMHELRRRSDAGGAGGPGAAPASGSAAG